MREEEEEEEEEEEAGVGSCQDFSAHFNYPVPYLLIYRMEVVLPQRSCRGRDAVTKYAVLSRKRCIIDAELALPRAVCRPWGGRNLSLRVSCHHTDEAIQEDGTTAEFIFTDALHFFFPRHDRVSAPYRWPSGSNGEIGKEGSVIMAQG